MAQETQISHPQPKPRHSGDLKENLQSRKHGHDLIRPPRRNHGAVNEFRVKKSKPNLKPRPKPTARSGGFRNLAGGVLLQQIRTTASQRNHRRTLERQQDKQQRQHVEQEGQPAGQQEQGLEPTYAILPAATDHLNLTDTDAAVNHTHPPPPTTFSSVDPRQPHQAPAGLKINPVTNIAPASRQKPATSPWRSFYDHVSTAYELPPAPPTGVLDPSETVTSMAEMPVGVVFAPGQMVGAGEAARWKGMKLGEKTGETG